MSSSRLAEVQVVAQAADRVPAMIHEWTGIEPAIQPASDSQDQPGAAGADFYGQLADVAFVVEVKREGDLAHVSRAIDTLGAYAAEGLCPIIVVPYMSKAGRERCNEAGVSWVDLSGNACLRLEGNHTRIAVWVEGKPDAFRRRGRPRNAFAPKAARIVRHLLLHPNRWFTQAEIAKETGVGAGYTSRLVRRLEDLDLVVRNSDKAVRPRSYDLLLDAWAEADAFRHDVVQGHVPGRTGKERADRLAQAFESVGVRHAFTGLVAAWAYTHSASFRSVTCYAAADDPGIDLAAVLEEAGFRMESSAPNARILIPADEGVFDSEQRVEGLRCVSPVQVYVDLASEPERAAEMRDALRTHILRKDLGSRAPTD